MRTFTQRIESSFLWIIILFAGAALLYPAPFLVFKPYITFLLGIIMFGIGFTLDLETFKECWQIRWLILIAAIVNYIVMPVTALLIAKALRLTMMDLAGLIILSTCPGGTAANVMSYLAKANVALAVVLTFLTTFLAPLFMPGLVFLFLHTQIHVPFFDMLKSILMIVTLPLIVGLVLKHFLGTKTKHIKTALPVVSIFAIAIIVGCVMGLSRDKVFSLPLLLIAAVILLNILGYVYGYLFAGLAKLTRPNQQALSFEYGMQDSGLGIVIASTFFGPIPALASALYSLIQNISAPILIKLMHKNIVLQNMKT